VGSSPGRIKQKTTTLELLLLCQAHSTKEKEQRLESGQCVRVRRHVYPWSVVSVS